MGGIVSSVKQLTTKRGEPMVFLALDDPTGGGEVVVFNSTYASARELCVTDRILVIKGRIDHKQQGETKLIAMEVSAFEAVQERTEIRFKLDARAARAGLIKDLAHLVKDYPGPSMVFVSLETSLGPKTLALGPTIASRSTRTSSPRRARCWAPTRSSSSKSSQTALGLLTSRPIVSVCGERSRAGLPSLDLLRSRACLQPRPRPACAVESPTAAAPTTTIQPSFIQRSRSSASTCCASISTGAASSEWRRSALTRARTSTTPPTTGVSTTASFSRRTGTESRSCSRSSARRRGRTAARHQPAHRVTRRGCVSSHTRLRCATAARMCVPTGRCCRASATGPPGTSPTSRSA